MHKLSFMKCIIDKAVFGTIIGLVCILSKYPIVLILQIFVVKGFVNHFNTMNIIISLLNEKSNDAKEN